MQGRAGEVNCSRSSEAGCRELDMRDVKEMAEPDGEVKWQAWETAEEAANAFEGNICDSGLVARTVIL